MCIRDSTTSPRIAAGDLEFSSKFRKVLRAGGLWFESGQRTFMKLDKFNIKFRFSDFFGLFLHLEISYACKLTSKTKYYVEFIKFHKCPLTGFEPRTLSSSQDFSKF